VTWIQLHNWCSRIENLSLLCRDIDVKVLKFVKFLLSKCTHEPSTVLLKIKMVAIVNRCKLKPTIEVRTILDECKERHWGMLPSVFQIIINCDAYSFSEKLTLYYQTKSLIDSKMHDITVNLTSFYLNAAEFLSSEKITYPEVVTELKYVMEKLKNEDDPQIDFLWADMLFHEKKFEEALIYAIKYEKYFITKFGRAPCNTFKHLYFILCNCYRHLGNIKDAKICFQTVKKYAPLDPMTKRLKHVLDSYPSDQSQINEPRTYRHSKSLKKCSYHKCQNIEESKKQFLCCSQCKKVYYCSKNCQTKHWKVHHKHYCKK
jgi:tetratricopeptide (TPR) repeat protein